MKTELMRMVSEMGHEQVVFCNDHATGLKAIIAVHDTTLGPALGGCRFWNYADEEEAIFDVLRLSRGMTYKASVAGLPLGGGKSVIIGDPKVLKSEKLFRHFGRFVHSLSGRYITAEDVNVNVNDMEIVMKETPYVTGVSSRPGGSGDPSPVTAWGTFHGIRAAAKYKMGKTSLKGVSVAVQGCGAVGSHLCQLLFEAGAKLTVADINPASVEKVCSKYSAQVASIEKIHSLNVDIFSPCALGGGMNDRTIPEIKATVIAGAANNQLLEEGKHGNELRKRGILYAPDYVINAGGLINVCHELKGFKAQAALDDAAKIYDTLLRVFETADKSEISTSKASNELAEKRVNEGKKKPSYQLLHNVFDNQEWIVIK